MKEDATKVVDALLEAEPTGGDAYTGAAHGVLLKYHLVDTAGVIRQVQLEGDQAPGPIVNPEVINRFLALDPSKSKRIFDWIIYASGGGTDAVHESERALELAHNWIIDNRMKGLDRNEQQIKPMTREEAEADWKANSYPSFYESYFFADQDLAKDPQYPVFGWYREWPGRNSVYTKIEDAVTKWNALVADKKLIGAYNKMMPKEPFQVNMWDEQGKPRYKSAEELLNVVQKFKSAFAKRKAEKNVVYIGKSQDPAKPGYVKGGSEVLYDDALMTVVIPATAAASMRSGRANWCIANKTRWNSYFDDRDKSQFSWASYTNNGPFAFWTFKPHLAQDADLQQIAGHLKCGSRQGAAGIEFWDGDNQEHISYEGIVRRLERAIPGSRAAFDASVKEVLNWFNGGYKQGDLEHFPALEGLAAKLVDAILS